MRAAIEEAHHAGLKTATHAQGTPGIANAVNAGIDSVEHAYYLTEELVEKMLKKGTYLIPTITSLTNIVDNGKDQRIPAWAVEKAKMVMDQAFRSHEMAREAGVPIAMGTDAGTPYNVHGENGNELVAMTEWGFSPSQAITCATYNAAKLLGLEHTIGTIAPGKIADILVVKGNPLDDISLLGPNRGIEAVYKSGIPVVTGKQE
jgi:imidazolonepropionase-like amidohydrolase